MTQRQELLKRLYRLALIGGVGLLVFQLAWRYRAPTPKIDRPKIAKVVEGDTLQDVTVTSYVMHSQSTPPVSMRFLHQLTGAGCALFVFFDSDCSICQDISDDWSGRRTLIVGRDTLPVRWIGARVSDTGAVTFIRHHDLADESYSLRSDKDAAVLGIFGTPLVYLVDQHRVFRKRMKARPSAITALPISCQSPPNGLSKAGAR
jgi:hypothetical protein